jgi:hypothetical protein
MQKIPLNPPLGKGESFPTQMHSPFAREGRGIFFIPPLIKGVRGISFDFITNEY